MVSYFSKYNWFLFIICLVLYFFRQPLFGFCKNIFQKNDWASERNITRWYKQGLALAWIAYFLLREELVKEILGPVGDYLKTFPIYPLMKDLYVNRLTSLLVFTSLLVLAKLIYFILRWSRFINYSSLDRGVYPEYDFSFQEELVSFLNRKEERGRNIFWLNGAWGSGKTHFIRTFFENQLYKPNEIYYISCFGIRTREQAEKVLVDEIEQHSTFGSLDYIPVVSSLVKWTYKILGLDLMKKHSLIIFDDLERVAYSKKQEDNPAEYNDILGFIDYLANHRNQKVLVLMNKKDMENTYQQILEEKFKPNIQELPNLDELVGKIIKEKELPPELLDIIQALYKIIIDEIQDYNLRELSRDLEIILTEKDYDRLIVDLLNTKREIFEGIFDSNLAQYSFNFHYGILSKVSPQNQLLIALSKTLYMSGRGEFRRLWWDGFRGFTIGEQGGYWFSRKYLLRCTDEIVAIHYDIENNQIQPNYSIREFECEEFLKVNKSQVNKSLIFDFPPDLIIENETLGSYVKKNPDSSLKKMFRKGKFAADWKAYFASQSNEGDTP